MPDVFASIERRRGHFTTESGYHTDDWMDLETLCRRPDTIRPFARELAARLGRYTFDAVCGPLNEGAFVALMVAEELQCEFGYAERIADPDRSSLYPVRYELPPPLRSLLSGRRVAVVNDVISAGSAVRGTYANLIEIGAEVVAFAALLVLGDSIDRFAAERQVAIEALSRSDYSLWTPDACPLCAAGEPIST